MRQPPYVLLKILFLMMSVTIKVQMLSANNMLLFIRTSGLLSLILLLHGELVRLAPTCIWGAETAACLGL